MFESEKSHIWQIAISQKPNVTTFLVHQLLCIFRQPAKSEIKGGVNRSYEVG